MLPLNPGGPNGHGLSSDTAVDVQFCFISVVMLQTSVIGCTLCPPPGCAIFYIDSSQRENQRHFSVLLLPTEFRSLHSHCDPICR
jgi:hypothetical protein